jgi:hypothetical protein
MTNKQTTQHLFTILLMLLLGTFTSAPLVPAQKPAAAKAASPSGPKEGIKVHGHWTIEIRNPDGRLVERREFKNALSAFGKASLARFLQRVSKPGEWIVELRSATFSPEGPCGTSSLIGSPCRIYEKASQLPEASSTEVFKTLTVSSQSETNNTVLSGTATATRTESISTVATQLYRCPADTQGVCPHIPNEECVTGLGGILLCSPNVREFTGTTLATPINVVAGQIIQVTVVISFS